MNLENVILRDVIANRPSPLIPGRLFFSTDEGLCYRDTGTAWQVTPLLVTRQLAIWFPNTASGRVVQVCKAAKAFSIPVSFSGWQAKVTTNPSATATYSFKKNGTEFGTLAVSTGGALTWTSAAGASFAVGDELSIAEPTDSSLANVNITGLVTE